MKPILLLLILCLSPILNAQERMRTCRTLFLNGPEQAAHAYYLFDGKQSREVELPRLSLSPVYEFRPGDLKLWLLTSPAGEADDIPEATPSVVIPAGVMDFYLLIAHDPANQALPLRMQCVNAGHDHVGRGDMLWFNLTPKQIAGKIGRSTLNLPPMKSTLVKEPALEQGDYPVEIYFRVPNDDRTHPLIESRWRHDPSARSLVFVFDEGNRRAPRVRSFSDFRMAEKKKDL
ncbi:MAG: hypothetical protein ACO3JG_08330 [Luteolibacter sp.]